MRWPFGRKRFRDLRNVQRIGFAAIHPTRYVFPSLDCPNAKHDASVGFLHVPPCVISHIPICGFFIVFFLVLFQQLREVAVILPALSTCGLLNIRSQTVHHLARSGGVVWLRSLSVRLAHELEGCCLDLLLLRHHLLFVPSFFFLLGSNRVLVPSRLLAIFQLGEVLRGADQQLVQRLLHCLGQHQRVFPLRRVRKLRGGGGDQQHHRIGRAYAAFRQRVTDVLCRSLEDDTVIQGESHFPLVFRPDTEANLDDVRHSVVVLINRLAIYDLLVSAA